MSIIVPANQRRAPNVRIITYTDVDRVGTVDDSGMSQEEYLKSIFRQYRGQTIQINKRHFKKIKNTDTLSDQIITDSQITQIPVNGFNSWWRQFTGVGEFMYPDSEDWIFSEVYNPGGVGNNQSQITIMSANRVGQSSYEQYFLDGTTHCLFI